MVVAKNMKKPIVQVSMDSDSEEDTSADESVESEKEDEVLNENEHKNDASSDDDDGEDADAESVDSNDNDNKDREGKDGVLVTNEGWADSVAKILGSNKPKNKKTLVLSRAKKHAEIVKAVVEEKPAFEVIGEEAEQKPTVKKEETTSSEPPAKKLKHEKPSLRVKPNILEKDRERLLCKIATKGVVQLFNAVRNQQKTLEKDLDRNDLSESKKEKILKKFDKRAFLDTLMGQSKSILVDEETKATKKEVKDEDKPKWSALRDDFMMGAKMKDWDKESVDE